MGVPCPVIGADDSLGRSGRTARFIGIPIDFILFALILAGIALFHRHTLAIAVTGLAVISLFKIAFSPFAEGSGLDGWLSHFGHEWVLLTNLLGLLLGFALLSKRARSLPGCRSSCPTTGRAASCCW